MQDTRVLPGVELDSTCRTRLFATFDEQADVQRLVSPHSEGNKQVPCMQRAKFLEIVALRLLDDGLARGRGLVHEPARVR